MLTRQAVFGPGTQLDIYCDSRCNDVELINLFVESLAVSHMAMRQNMRK